MESFRWRIIFSSKTDRRAFFLYLGRREEIVPIGNGSLAGRNTRKEFSGIIETLLGTDYFDTNITKHYEIYFSSHSRLSYWQSSFDRVTKGRNSALHVFACLGISI